jgi:hypothetical protein
VEEAMLLGKRDGDFAGSLTVAASYTVMGYFLRHMCAVCPPCTRN